jgi:hypothetical protein
VIEHKVNDGAVRFMALSGDSIVTRGNGVIQVFNVSTCLLLLPSCYFFLLSFRTVEMIKQFLESVGCCSLTFHGGVVCIGSSGCVIQWNLATDAVVRLEGFPGLIDLTYDLLGLILL